MQKLEIAGIIIVFLGISFIIYGAIIDDFRWRILLVIFPLLGIGFGVMAIPRIMVKKRESDLEKRKNNQSAESLKDSSNTDGQTTTSDTELGRQCKVCNTNIPPNVKTCPGCGDIYS